MTPQIEQVDWEELRADLLQIRYRVFVHEQGVPLELEQDAQDPRALHLLAWSEERKAVGCARLLPDGQIGRLAVLPTWRRRGIGSALLRELIHCARARGQDAVFLHAQCAAESFYRRFGFVVSSGVFKEAGVDHKRMQLPLTINRPPYG